MKVDLRFCDIKDPLPPRILKKFCKGCFKDVTLYPQNYNKLIKRLARKLKVKPDNIVLVNGVDEGIELISRVFGQDILIFPPTYYEFKDAPRRNGLKLTELYSVDEGGFYRIRAYDEELRNRSLIFLCSPNMPFGFLEPDEIIGIARKTKGIVAVDETYIDFAGRSVVGAFRGTPNLLVLRSFSKGYSLAGLRIGYIVGAKKLIDKIKAIKLICNVTSVSVNAAMVVLDEEKYFRGLRKQIIKRKRKFERLLTNKGLNVLKTETNVILLRFPSVNEANKFVYLKRNGIEVNQGDGVSTYGLDRSYVRFACGTEAQMKYASRIVEKFKSSASP